MLRLVSQLACARAPNAVRAITRRTPNRPLSNVRYWVVNQENQIPRRLLIKAKLGIAVGLGLSSIAAAQYIYEHSEQYHDLAVQFVESKDIKSALNNADIMKFISLIKYLKYYKDNIKGSELVFADIGLGEIIASGLEYHFHSKHIVLFQKYFGFGNLKDIDQLLIKATYSSKASETSFNIILRNVKTDGHEADIIKLLIERHYHGRIDDRCHAIFQKVGPKLTNYIPGLEIFVSNIDCWNIIFQNKLIGTSHDDFYNQTISSAQTNDVKIKIFKDLVSLSKKSDEAQSAIMILIAKKGTSSLLDRFLKETDYKLSVADVRKLNSLHNLGSIPVSKWAYLMDYPGFKDMLTKLAP